MDRRVTRHEQDVVEREGDVGPEGSHLESYSAGFVSSTGFVSMETGLVSTDFASAGFFFASSTAALPAAASPPRNRPALPTASIVPRMMFTGTRPARIVSSRVSATFWNAGAPAARCEYFDSRNSM